MRINIAVILVLFVSLLSGCATETSNYPDKNLPTQSQIPTAIESSVAITQAPSIVPSFQPEESPELQEIWEFFPGLKSKIDQFVTEKNCEGLNSLEKEYSPMHKDLEFYIIQAVEFAGCR